MLGMTTTIISIRRKLAGLSSKNIMERLFLPDSRRHFFRGALVSFLVAFFGRLPLARANSTQNVLPSPSLLSKPMRPVMSLTFFGRCQPDACAFNIGALCAEA